MAISDHPDFRALDLFFRVVERGVGYVSVLTIAQRQITHRRDYLDPVAVFDALGWPKRPVARTTPR